ncbi:MAG: hypothetical protein DMG09_23985, partial [Acidobacteria bacterium]
AFLAMPENRLTLGLALFAVVLAIVFWAHAYRMNLHVAALENAIARIEQNGNDLRRQIEGISAKRPGAAPLALKDGNRQILIDEKGELLGLDMLPANYRDALKDALTAGRISIPPPPETTIGQKGSTLGSSPQGRTFEALSLARRATPSLSRIWRLARKSKVSPPAEPPGHPTNHWFAAISMAGW